MPTKRMSGEEVLRQVYNERKALTEEVFVVEAFPQNYTGRFIEACRGMSSIATGAFNTPDGKYQAWYGTLVSLIDMCILKGVEPIYSFHINYEGNTYKTYPVKERELQTLNHLGDFITAQTTRLEPLSWIELGNKVGITDIDI